MDEKSQSFQKSKWLALFIVWGAFLVTYVLRTAWSTVAAPIGDSLGFAVAMLGSFITAFYIGYVIANLFSGFFTDMLGGRTMLLFSLLPLGILTYAFGHIQTLMTGIIIQFFMGVSAGADYSAGMKIIATWFDKDRGRALGLYTTATSLAVVLVNLIVPPLTQKYSWTIAFDVLAAGTLVWAVVTFLLLRDGSNTMRAKARRMTREDVKAVCTNRSLVLLSIAGFGGFWATVGFVSWGNALMTKGCGISVLDAGSVVAVFGIGAVIAKPILGWLSDLIPSKRRLVSIGCFIVFIILLSIFGQLSTLTVFYIIAPFIGAAAYGFMPVLMAQVSDAGGKKHAGTAAGLTNAIWQLGGSASPIVVGFFYAKTTSFAIALATLAVGPLFGMIALFFLSSVIVRETHAEEAAEKEAAKSSI
jgi:sugar phosphate permease